MHMNTKKMLNGTWCYGIGSQDLDKNGIVLTEAINSELMYNTKPPNNLVLFAMNWHSV